MSELLYNKSKAVEELNKVEGFYPLELARVISNEGQEEQRYLDVKYRKLWFRLVNPTGKIISRIVHFTENMAVVEARIYLDKCDQEDNYIANSFSQKFRTADTQFGDQVVHKEEPVEIFNAELADADVIDRTYQEMLSLLTLNDKHQEDLKKRGLTKEQIEIQRYRSVPLFGIKNMVQKLLESGQTVKGVPGFYEDQDGKWTINFTSKNSGILIPIRSMEGKIQGFQIRLDQVMEGRKYIWLSSVKFQNGVSSGSPVHVIGSLDAEQIYLTEGALKGTIAHYLSGDTFICVAGVNQYRNLKPVLETLKSRHLPNIWVKHSSRTSLSFSLQVVSSTTSTNAFAYSKSNICYSSIFIFCFSFPCTK